jgi:hypothetical protein
VNPPGLPLLISPIDRMVKSLIISIFIVDSFSRPLLYQPSERKRINKCHCKAV